jgi:hypothetical protein
MAWMLEWAERSTIVGIHTGVGRTNRDRADPRHAWMPRDAFSMTFHGGGAESIHAWRGSTMLRGGMDRAARVDIP